MDDVRVPLIETGLEEISLAIQQYENKRVVLTSSKTLAGSAAVQRLVLEVF